LSSIDKNSISLNLLFRQINLISLCFLINHNRPDWLLVLMSGLRLEEEIGIDVAAVIGLNG
jgi:hypothetical protein